MVAQVIKINIVQIRLYRKLDTGGVDQILTNALSERNGYAAGNITSGNFGYAHLEFAVRTTDCSVNTLNQTATAPESYVGIVSFLNNRGILMTMVVSDFIVESVAPNYNFYVNGWVGEDRVELNQA